MPSDPLDAVRALGRVKSANDGTHSAVMTALCLAIEEADKAGVARTDIIAASGLARRTVYRMLEGLEGLE
jgi:hypothetical protein